MSSPSKADRERKAAEETEWVRRIGNADADALSDLYSRYAGLLMALSQRVLGNAADAEEVLQEVFVQVWNQAARYDSRRSSVSTWLVLITRSRSIDRLRSRKVGERTLGSVRSEKGVSHASPQGVSDVLLGERRARLDKAMRALPPEQHEVLHLAFYKGLTQREIAATTGIPLGTVKTRTLLAMRKMRTALGPEIGELL
jgi:RNA polymerase sigma-70 factor (ECF subfamily)